MRVFSLLTVVFLSISLFAGCDDDSSTPLEVCDNATDDDGDGLFDCADPDCANYEGCTVSVYCGNGILEENEFCDDGNTDSGDGCDAACAIEDGYHCDGEPSVCILTCSDGVLDPGEECDDGNISPGDGCDDACMEESGYVCSGEPSLCVPSCGNAKLGGAEECDDGNTTNGDGCSDVCRVETGYDCELEPSVCTAVCGDGLILGTEECDDGNTADGDGCNATCLVEAGWECAEEPSDCLKICSDHDQCAFQQYCNEANRCVPQLQNGETCDDAEGGAECRSGNCMNSVCCYTGETCCTTDTDCGMCEQCNAMNYCEPQVGTDLKNECDGFNCSTIVSGWNGAVCEIFDSATSANGTCAGAGTCASLDDSCTGVASYSTSCVSEGCKISGSCVRGEAIFGADEVSEICHEAGAVAPGGDICLPGGETGLHAGTPCGFSDWTVFSGISWIHQNWEQLIISAYGFYPSQMLSFSTTSGTCDSAPTIPDNGTLQCNQAWVEFHPGMECPGVTYTDNMTRVSFDPAYNGVLMDQNCTQSCVNPANCPAAVIQGYDCNTALTFRNATTCSEERVFLSTKDTGTTNYCVWAR